jgi:hypothetical protein
MEILRNNKGGAKLVLDGYMYTQKRVSDTKIYWRCAQTRRFHCSGSITTTSDVSTFISKTHAC